jgi:hypothetical protein
MRATIQSRRLHVFPDLDSEPTMLYETVINKWVNLKIEMQTDVLHVDIGPETLPLTVKNTAKIQNHIARFDTKDYIQKHRQKISLNHQAVMVV